MNRLWLSMAPGALAVLAAVVLFATDTSFFGYSPLILLGAGLVNLTIGTYKLVRARP
ncbi:hypothetical protein HPO96_04845 [Kribbella sandramycini]|uniref:Uncharacterized protein n=1 Tax=Kribbella sandramycini TaxID=60450 RepID=A0A7Y4KVU0_9ACTN|nr:hypothetical protein [Kribbella sandramycini]MBB6567837.1 hypothetical protein [Kribbella sandramycini]NOL39568.1 hypothetical protein [Kribbella sandramycini]